MHDSPPLLSCAFFFFLQISPLDFLMSTSDPSSSTAEPFVAAEARSSVDGAHQHDPKSSWASVVAGNRQKENGMNLSFVSQQFVEPNCIQFDESEWECGAEEWDLALVGYVLGFKAPYNSVKNYVAKHWEEQGPIEVLAMDSGILLFKFPSIERKLAVMKQGPWYFDNKPLLLTPWSVDLNVEDLNVSSIPIWVKLPNLKLHLWNEHALSKLASAIGKPVCSDSITAKKDRISFARVCIEIQADFELPQILKIKGPGGREFAQKVEYEWIPPRCSHCKVFGHKTDRCKKKNIRKVWVPKISPVDINAETSAVDKNSAPEENVDWQQVKGRNLSVGIHEEEVVNHVSPNPSEVITRNVFTPLSIQDENGIDLFVDLSQKVGSNKKKGPVLLSNSTSRGLRSVRGKGSSSKPG